METKYCKNHSFSVFYHFKNKVGFHLVRLIGLEPTSLAAPDPKSGVSTNFTTGAFAGAKLVKVERNTK